MRCVITYTSSTSDQDFAGAERVLSGLTDEHTLSWFSQGGPVYDDRQAVAARA